MKFFAIFFLVVLGGLVAGGGLLWTRAAQVARGDATAAFAHDVARYVAVHGGALPSDWVQFEA